MRKPRLSYQAHEPPTRGFFSTSNVSRPALASSAAAAVPPIPAPITHTARFTTGKLTRGESAEQRGEPFGMDRLGQKGVETLRVHVAGEAGDGDERAARQLGHAAQAE